MVPEGELTAAAEWRRYWPLALAGLTGFSFMSFMIPATGVFMGPLADEFGWSRTQLSSGQAISAFLPLFLVPLIGVMIDKWGTRRIALPGIVLTGIAIAGFSQLNGSFAQWIGLWIAFGLCSLFVQSSVWSTAVASVFKAGRGLALGVTLSGTAVAQVVVPPLANWLIASVGWRAAFLWLAGGWGGLALLLSVLFLYDAHDARARDSTKTAANLQQNKVGAFNVFNLFMKYDVPGESTLLKDLSFTLNVDNLFDKAPPLYRGTYSGGGNTSVGFANGFTLGRLIRIGASKKF